MGNVVLGGASTFSVDFTGDNLLRFEVVDPVKQTPKNADGSRKRRWFRTPARSPPMAAMC